ncbi:hypothetical protein SAMN05421538_10974 [Paracoccus isoporae]|uniref:Uncharacterized protein n=2 Tax=Paracoccus isoporae TaxID=591205 RepID=A0A1G7EU67_9RHOB|nr:hypothetical protein SAMN05421538_10974 [Paracoccus isoporae]
MAATAPAWAQTGAATETATLAPIVWSHKDRNMPVKGTRISPADIGDDGHNFRYCNGDTGTENMNDFVKRGESCPPDGIRRVHSFTREDLRLAPIYTEVADMAAGQTGYEPRGQIAPPRYDEIAAGNATISADWEVFGAMSAVPVMLDLADPGIEYMLQEDGELAVLLPREKAEQIDKLARDYSAAQAAMEIQQAAEVATALHEEEVAQEAAAAAQDMDMEMDM